MMIQKINKGLSIALKSIAIVLMVLIGASAILGLGIAVRNKGDISKGLTPDQRQEYIVKYDTNVKDTQTLEKTVDSLKIRIFILENRNKLRRK